jgi:hypothetical protein
MSNNISTNFSGFANLQDTTALKTKILSLTLPAGTNVVNTAFYYFGAGLERGSIVTNIIPSLNPVAAGTGDMTVSYIDTTVDPDTVITLGAITAVDPAADIPDFNAIPASLNVPIAGNSTIRVAFQNGAALAAATTYRFAIIYKKGH